MISTFTANCLPHLIQMAGVETIWELHALPVINSWHTPNTLHLGCSSYHLHSSHHFFSTWGVVMLEITPQVEKRKKKSNEFWEKPQKCMCISNVLAFFSKPKRTSWSLTYAYYYVPILACWKNKNNYTLGQRWTSAVSLYRFVNIASDMILREAHWMLTWWVK